jgi:predicted DNA-binding protein with PD1-like motif
MNSGSSGRGPLTSGRSFLERLPHDSDLASWLSKFADDNGISAGTVSVIGAVKNAVVAFYDQQAHTYGEIRKEENLEIVYCAGNVSMRDGKPFAHCHAMFSNKQGETFGGHLMEGTKVFAAEAHFQELLGGDYVRERDSVTGLPLWR